MKKTLFIALLAFVLSATSASACSYLYRTPQEKLAAADIVFVGTVTGGETVETAVTGEGLNTPGTRSVSRTDFKVVTAIKGNPQASTSVYSSHTVGMSCGSFRGIKDHQYLVFANELAGAPQLIVTEIGAEDLAYAESHKTLNMIGSGTPVVDSPSATSTPPVVLPGNTPNTVGKFNKNLKLGMRHIDVKRLQTFLNRSGFPVAAQGAGSLGQEGYYFGPATLRALMAFQNAHKAELKISAGTGFFGATTRALLNK